MPDSPLRPYLVPVFVPGRGVVEGPAIRLEVGRTLLGREEGEGVLGFPTDSRVSRHHAGLTLEEESWRLSIEDLASKNGTFVNGRPVEMQHLIDGDLLRIGESFFVVRWRARAEEPASDLGGRAPAMSVIRQALSRLSPHTARVLIEGPKGATFDPLVGAVHRRINPEGGVIHLEAEGLESEVLRRALAETSTVVLSCVEALGAAAVGALVEGPRSAPVVVTTEADTEEAVIRGHPLGAVVRLFEANRLRAPRLAERREDLLGLLVASLGDDLPLPTPELVETLLIYDWPGDMKELAALAADLRVRGAGLDALVTELVSPRLRGKFQRSDTEVDPFTEMDVRRPVPSRQDLEGLLAIHSGSVDAIAEALGRSRMEVMTWLQKHALED